MHTDVHEAIAHFCDNLTISIGKSKGNCSKASRCLFAEAQLFNAKLDKAATYCIL